MHTIDEYNYLVSLDMGAIHEYIFGTNKLKEIRGASIILDRLNRKISLEKLEECKIEDTNYKCVIAGGGNIKVLFNDKTQAEKYKNSLTKAFEEMSGVKFAIILSERNGEFDDEWIKRAERELQKEKNMPETRYQILSSGFFKACQACGQYPAEKKDPYERERFICKSCYQKIEESKEYQNARIYEKLFDTIGFKPEFPKDFNEIGECSEPEGYIGFIYADGNRMGEHLEGISTFDKPFDELERFSKEVDKATLDAVIDALKKHFEEELFPFQIILAGGDDLILAVPANKAIDVAINFCKNFEKTLESTYTTKRITTSASIVLCHDSFPIKNVLDVAESLIKNAKVESRKNNGESYLDFIVITGSSLEDPIAKRKEELEYQNIFGTHHLTKRPYSVKEMENLVKSIQDLKKVKFPNSKLKALYSSLFNGCTQSVLDAQYIRMRLKDKHRGVLDHLTSQSHFPWEKEDENVNIYTTPIGDIVELYKFIGVDNNEK